MKHIWLLLLAALSAPDAGQSLSEELAWVIPPGWMRVDVHVDIAAHDPQEPEAVVTVFHVRPASGERLQIDFLRKALVRFPIRGVSAPTAMLGTCSDGTVRFACEELQIQVGHRLDVAYAWVDEGRGWGFSARYTLPERSEEHRLPLVRRVIGWKGTGPIRE